MKNWLKLLLFYLLAMLVIGFVLQTTYKNLRVNILTQRTETQKIAYSSVLQSNKILADTFYHEVLNQEKILALVHKIVHSEGDEQIIQRGLLYRALSATYQRSKKNVVKILHFHFPDNRSLLRFHLPQNVGDDLTDIRPAIALVNSSLLPVHGYEPGRYINGYRHVYPLLYHGEHIGSVEVSNPYRKIYHKVQQLETAQQTQFVFFQKKQGGLEKSFAENELYYVANEIHPDFIRSKYISELFQDQEQKEEIPTEIHNLFAQLKNNPRVQKNMSQGVAFNLSVTNNNKSFSVVFHPVADISYEKSGYLIGFTSEPNIEKLADQFLIYFLLTGTVLLAILIYRASLQSTLEEKKKTEEALKAIYDNKLTGMVTLDAEGFYKQINRQWEVMTGYSRDELLTMNFRDLSYPDEQLQTPIIERLAENVDQQTFQREKRYIRKDGSVFWGELSGTGLYDHHRRLIGMVGIITDTTDRKSAQASLLEANTIINRSPAVAFLWRNEDGWPVDYVSGNVEMLFGYSSLDFRSGKVRYLELIHADDQERVTGEVVSNSQKRTQNTFTHKPYRILTQNGEVKWVNDTTYMRRNPSGEITHYEGVVYDITELKQVENELFENKMHLEDLINEQTKDLENKVDTLETKTGQLEKSEQALIHLVEDVNESRAELQSLNSKYAAINTELKEFAYIVSHDLKAPLRAISQLTHWIAEDYANAFDEDGRMQMDLILQRVKRMDSLIEGILRYSRIGQIRGKMERIDLNELIAELVASIAPPETIQISIANELPVVYLDTLRVGQLFQNLIENAIKYMDKDKGVVEINCTKEENFWQFTISDNGPGISKKYHDKIFQIFQTLSPRDENESTGIGLALVKKIVSIYGGEIWVEAEEGHGTTFFFTLPDKEITDEKH